VAISKLSFKSEFQVQEANINTVFAFIQNDFSQCTQSEALSWAYTSFYGNKDQIGFYQYTDFWVRQFHSLNRSDALIQSINLSVGPVTGFGVGNWGVQKWGIPRTGFTVSRSYTDRYMRYYNITWNFLP